MKKKMMMMMRLKRSPSEDVIFPSLFLVFDAKGGEEVLSSSIYLDIFISLGL
jgi:hypothetical protein